MTSSWHVAMARWSRPWKSLPLYYLRSALLGSCASGGTAGDAVVDKSQHPRHREETLLAHGSQPLVLDRGHHGLQFGLQLALLRLDLLRHQTARWFVRAACRFECSAQRSSSNDTSADGRALRRFGAPLAACSSVAEPRRACTSTTSDGVFTSASTDRPTAPHVQNCCSRCCRRRNALRRALLCLTPALALQAPSARPPVK